MIELYYGVVEDAKDPDTLGRYRVRVHDVHNADIEIMPVNMLPWCYTMAPTTSPSISGLGQSPFIVQGATVILSALDKNLQSFLIIGTLPTVALGDTKIDGQGFKDPDRQWPRNPATPDVNMRYRGIYPNVYRNEIKGKYEPNRIVKPEYPKNNVFETRKGHIKEYDDSDGAPRIHERHSSGTYYEVGPNGSKVTKVVGNNYTLVAGEDTVEVMGNVNIITNGNCNIQAGGDTDIASSGDIRISGSHASVKMDGMFALKADSKIKLQTLSDVDLTASGQVIITEDPIMYCSLPVITQAGPQDYDEGFQKEYTTESSCVTAGGTWLPVKGAENPGIIIQAENDIKINGNQKLMIASKGNMDISSEGDINLDTPNGVIHMNKTG